MLTCKDGPKNDVQRSAKDKHLDADCLQSPLRSGLTFFAAKATLLRFIGLRFGAPYEPFLQENSDAALGFLPAIMDPRKVGKPFFSCLRFDRCVLDTVVADQVVQFEHYLKELFREVFTQWHEGTDIHRTPHFR
ncbi:hypothetical protein DZC73_25860 [Albitalea terrae]|uniref:Uncharacterized protein n=1 Tax=Piscinibacter terrae TaxID=2496871 RepID=A0A3N7HIL7_9BURK|nr:hypothetical protein DZC73_25860 [Albitalea terrae]